MCEVVDSDSPSGAQDEYWQGPEVAHVWSYGTGHLTWEWETCIALRGVLHPGEETWCGRMSCLGHERIHLCDDSHQISMIRIKYPNIMNYT